MSRFVPRGVAVADLGKRIAAALIDALPAAVIGGVAAAIYLLVDGTTVHFVTALVAAILLGAYWLYQWWAYGSRSAGLGARAMGLKLVGINSGDAIGWWRFFLRTLVFTALLITVVGGIALLIFTAIHERRQGWHDMAARSLLVQPKKTTAAKTDRKRDEGPSTVGLPPHLSSSFAPTVGTSSASEPASWAPQEPERPAWMPQVQEVPVQPYVQQPTPGQPFTSGGYPSPVASQPSAGGVTGPPPPAAQPVSAPSQQSLPPQPQQRRSWIPVGSANSVLEPPRPAPRVRERGFPESDDDGTRLQQPPAQVPQNNPGDSWMIRLDDGRQVPLLVPVLLGRNPQKTQGDPDVQLVPAGGDGRMISRTHVMIGADAGGVYVIDRGSTNGTALVRAEGQLEPCPTGTQVRVGDGQRVSYGDRWFSVQRRG